MFLVSHRAPHTGAECRALAAAGAQVFELDVQLRADGMVVSHYMPLRGPWARLPLECDNWRFRRTPGHDPRLVDVLAELPRDCRILLDPKHRPDVSSKDLQAALLEVVRASGDPSRFVVSTSSPGLLDGYRAAGLGTWKSIGDRPALQRVLDGDPLPEEGVSVRHSLLDAETVAGLHARTGIIVAWTVNGVHRARLLTDLGVDAITTDRVRALAALATPGNRAR